jgi:5,6-dimethylbenzimidazole synthase
MSAPVFAESFQAQFLELLRWRRDVRRFRSDPVPPTLLHELLAAAEMAPSVGLSQPWRFVQVDEPARRAAILENFQSCNARALASLEGPDAETYATLRLAGLSDAPCHLAAFAEPNPQQGRVLGRMTMPEMAIYSAVMAVHTLWLMARTVGLGVGWVSILDPARVSSVLDVPPHWVFLGYLCIGYPTVESDTPELERLGWERRRGGLTLLQR